MQKKSMKLFSLEKERLVAEELDHYFRVPSDNRDLNYNKFFFEGKQSKDLVDYNSFNTNRLSEKKSLPIYWQVLDTNENTYNWS